MRKKKHFESIIQGQEKEIMALSRENLKFQLELDEAEAVIKKVTTELDNIREEFNSLNKNFKEIKSLNIDITTNEMYEYPPLQVYEMFKQEAILSKKKSLQIKCLLDENKSYKNSLIKLKQDNDDLRDKVVKLIEEDIDKKILNFTIEENRKLELKIKIQRDRNVGMGLEYRAQLDKACELEEKIKTLEKNSKNNSLIRVGDRDNEWETISINSDPEVNIAPASPKTSSPNSIEFLVKKTLKQILDDEKNCSKNVEKKTEKNESLKEIFSHTPNSRAKTGQNNLNEKKKYVNFISKIDVFLAISVVIFTQNVQSKTTFLPGILMYSQMVFSKIIPVLVLESNIITLIQSQVSKIM